MGMALFAGSFIPFQPGSYGMYVRNALESASIDLLAGHYAPQPHFAEATQTEQKHDSSQETRLSEQNSVPSVSHSGQTKTADPTINCTEEEAREATVMAALEAEWEHEWAAEGAKLKLFYLMREALAPLVEAVLLVDRAIYLIERINAVTRRPSPDLERENDADDGGSRQQSSEGIVRLFPLFDPALSPRNICLFASAPATM
jgi:hypothetical protein